MGRAGRLCPGTSDVNLLRNGQSVVDLNAEIPNGALDLPMAQQELDRAQISGPAVDERCLGSPQRMRPEEARVQADSGNPLGYQPRVLSGRHGGARATAAGKEELPGFLPAALI